MMFHGGIFFFLSAAGLTFTGIAAEYRLKESYTNVVHYAGAIVCIVSALLGFLIEYHFMIPIITWGLSLLTLYLFKIKEVNLH